MSNNPNISIREMSDDELWQWWLSLSDEWKWLFLEKELDLCLWDNHLWFFDKDYNYRAEFDWLNRELVFDYLKEIQEIIAINFESNEIEDISGLAHLTWLTDIEIWENKIQNIAILANFNQLTYLDLSDNQIHDISALANLTELTELNFGHNQIQDIFALANLVQLQALILDNNQIQDISPFSNLTQLSRLILENNQIQDISVLANLTRLTYLNLMGNPINPKDIEWLKEKLPNCDIEFDADD